MEPLTLLFLLMAVLFGSYIQTVTGFAMGMIIVATVGGLGLLQLSVLAILVSLLTSVNSFLSLRGNWSRIEFRFFLFLALGQFPAIVFGIELLNFLESNEVWILKIILGSFLVLGGLLSFVNPRPLKRLSGRLTVFLAGILGGTLGGLFSASGPVLGLLRAENLDQAIHIANSTLYGLTSGIHSLDKREQQKWQRLIIAGNCYINRSITGAIVRRQAFGGTKNSCFGHGSKAGGPNYLTQFMYAKQEGIPKEKFIGGR